MSITEFSSQPFTSATPIWQNFLELSQDVKPYLQYPSTQVDDDNTLQLFVDSACWWVQDYLARPVAPTEFFKRFDGWTSWQGSYIILPYAPVLRMINITEWWGTSGPHVLSEQTPANQFGQTGSLGQSDVYQLEPTTGVVRRTFPGLVQKPFFPGSRNIEISWVAGFAPIPPQIKLATLELINWWYRSTQEAPRMAAPRMGFATEEPRNELWPAIPSRVTALLQPYMQQGIG